MVDCLIRIILYIKLAEVANFNVKDFLVRVQPRG